MKKVVVFVLLFFALPTSAHAFTPKDFGAFALGAISAITIHEAGHFIAGKVTHTNLDWGSPVKFSFTPKNDSDGRIVASAGIVANMVTTEVILNTNINKDNWYMFGLLTASILEPFVYVLRDRISHDAPDIETMHQYGLDRKYVCPVIVLHSIFSAYRIWSNQHFPFSVEVGDLSFTIKASIKF